MRSNTLLSPSSQGSIKSINYDGGLFASSSECVCLHNPVFDLKEEPVYIVTDAHQIWLQARQQVTSRIETEFHGPSDWQFKFRKKQLFDRFLRESGSKTKP